MGNEKKVLDALEEEIMNGDISDSEKSKLMSKFLQLKDQKINLMITGATGCGKSSTINALFDMEVAKVGVGVDPETMEIEKFELDHLVLLLASGGINHKQPKRISQFWIRRNSQCHSHSLLIC